MLFLYIECLLTFPTFFHIFYFSSSASAVSLCYCTLICACSVLAGNLFIVVSFLFQSPFIGWSSRGIAASIHPPPSDHHHSIGVRRRWAKVKLLLREQPRHQHSTTITSQSFSFTPRRRPHKQPSPPPSFFPYFLPPSILFLLPFHIIQPAHSVESTEQQSKSVTFLLFPPELLLNGQRTTNSNKNLSKEQPNNNGPCPYTRSLPCRIRVQQQTQQRSDSAGRKEE